MAPTANVGSRCMGRRRLLAKISRPKGRHITDKFAIRKMNPSLSLADRWKKKYDTGHINRLSFYTRTNYIPSVNATMVKDAVDPSENSIFTTYDGVLN